MGNIKVERDKEHLYFVLPNGIKEIRYDLKNREMQRLKKGQWIKAKYCYKNLKGYSISDLEGDESKFIEMVKETRRLNERCSSLSTFISRLSDGYVAEEYISEGVKYDLHTDWRDRRRRGITKPLSWYNKHIIKMFKIARRDTPYNDGKFCVDFDFETNYENYKDLWDKISNIILTLQLTPDQIYLVLDINRRTLDDINYLIIEHRYELKSLLSYILNYLGPFENLGVNDAVELLASYYRMANNIGRNVDKYPKYLRSIHDIITANYNTYKREYSEELFKKRARPELQYEKGKYCIIIPETTKNIISEGTSLNHCVSSYVQQIIDGATYIFFMRLKDIPEESLITLELKGGSIIQAKGAHNRTLTKEEMEFLEQYATLKELTLRISPR